MEITNHSNVVDVLSPLHAGWKRDTFGRLFSFIRTLFPIANAIATSLSMTEEVFVNENINKKEIRTNKGIHSRTLCI